MNTTTSTELVRLDEITALDLFKPESGVMTDILKKLYKAALSDVMDGTTPEGRLQCGRQKKKVIAIQKWIAEQKKEQTTDLKKITSLIDSEGKRANDLCEELKTEIMRPRVEWEDNDALRKKSHLEAIEFINELRTPRDCFDKKLTLEAYQTDMTALGTITVDKSFEEFEERGKVEYKLTSEFLSNTIDSLTQQIKDAEELAELKKADADRKLKEREEELRKEGEEKAKAKLLKEQEEAKEKTEPLPAPTATEVRELREENTKVEQSPFEPLSPDARERLTATEVNAETEHRRAINREVISYLINKHGLTEKKSEAIVIDLYYKQFPHVTISYQN